MPTDGLLVLDKPAGPTSHDVVRAVRRILGTRRVGHGGTLDPGATGVLLVAAGRATRLFPYLFAEDKVYEGRVRLGFSTDTYDSSGRPTSAECRVLPGLEEIGPAMKAFEGKILQTPPRYSAKKLGGRPVYQLARADKAFTLQPAPVTIIRFALRAYHPPDLDFEVECSAGTYVRSLAHDLGTRLGCGAHLAALRRMSVGPYTLKDAVTLAGLEDAAARGESDKHVLPLEVLILEAPAVTVDEESELRVRHGAPLDPAHCVGPRPGPAPFPDGTRLVRVFSGSGKLLALARPSADGARLLPFLVVS